MSRISTCLHCGRRVALPDSVESTVEVQCPLCEARFPLAEVVDAAESFPLLIVVGAQDIAAEEDNAAIAADLQEQTPGAEEETDEVVSVLLGDEKTSDISEEVLASDTVVGHAKPAAEEEQSVESAQPDSVGFAIDTGEVEPAQRSLAQRARSGPPLRGRKPKSAVRELAGIVLGGAAGLLIAYYCLNFFGGAQFDMLKIPLPFVPHTYQHWPGAESAQDEAGDASAQMSLPNPSFGPARCEAGRVAGRHGGEWSLGING